MTMIMRRGEKETSDENERRVKKKKDGKEGDEGMNSNK